MHMGSSKFRESWSRAWSSDCPSHTALTTREYKFRTVVTWQCNPGINVIHTHFFFIKGPSHDIKILVFMIASIVNSIHRPHTIYPSLMHSTLFCNSEITSELPNSLITFILTNWSQIGWIHSEQTLNKAVKGKWLFCSTKTISRAQNSHQIKCQYLGNCEPCFWWILLKTDLSGFEICARLQIHRPCETKLFSPSVFNKWSHYKT